ncbi:LysE family transporter [Novipirellula artificiosorum]|uniref:LysE type translocator n=1 Tax=Novipirellula artificiosorum TaxID=2528016 RepID=A0A5C6DBW4_9BACT|nr:LysE family transporter [Novipirellula artificiosorum]TWU34302.1 LysE type translocator [Novipirellula artificiosorum]
MFVLAETPLAASDWKGRCDGTMLTFFVSAIAISLSGVMAPGPITAATLAAGARHRHAGAMIALGHAVVEVPLILLLVFGASNFLDSPTARAVIGLTGGAVLLLMGLQLLLSLRQKNNLVEAPVQRHPLVIGIVLTAANPYFLVWWATVGLTLATEALTLGIVVLALFTIVHWLCDLGWLEVLSMAGFKGSEIFGERAQFVVSAVCGVVLLGFGGKFLYDASLVFPFHSLLGTH